MLLGIPNKMLESMPFKDRSVPARRNRTTALKFLAILVISFAVSLAASAQSARESVVTIVAQIQRADYEGDRPALKRLYGELAPFADNQELASRVRYWRGFALWRRAINASNDSVDPKEIEADLKAAVEEFNASAAKDPAFVDAKIGALGCLGFIMYLNQKDSARLQELAAQVGPLIKEAKDADPDNPRLLWVLSPMVWNSPPERGGGQDKAIESALKGLEVARKRKIASSNPLDPSWGEPELLMGLAWDNLHRTTPDLNAADQYAHSALAQVPYWHYVRDILVPQIRDARNKAN
ncbi:MAG TPA: hypothetical protein VGZ48_13720 [Candidatus Acidoferrales bacterium]|jgi:hypothetical protein|nr:hypothetical protein [Candidatus Acidoferrales bacterium]